jgi:virulence-associated protein VagC
LGQSLNETLTLHTTLCRREAGAFVKALQGNEPMVVACTQEQRLFGELAQQSAEAAGRSGWAPIQFVNIRETAGWSREAEQATPKIAALLAAARLPEPEPVPTVSYRSQGRVLIIGPLDQAQQAAELLGGPAWTSACSPKARERPAAHNNASTRCCLAASSTCAVGWAPSSLLGNATTPLTWTCAPAATPAWPPARSRSLAWITKWT